MDRTLMINAPDDMVNVARVIRSEHPDVRIIALYGDLGAGKTTLVKSFARELDVIDEVSSPTFALVNEYHTRSGEPVYHLDLYRIESLEEAIDAGIEEYLHTNHYCFIEWPGIAEPLFPANTLKIKIEGLDKSLRKVLIL